MSCLSNCTFDNEVILVYLFSSALKSSQVSRNVFNILNTNQQFTELEGNMNIVWSLRSFQLADQQPVGR